MERPLRSKNVTLIGAIAIDGPRAFRRVEGTADAADLTKFLKEELGPNLKPGEVVAMDVPRFFFRVPAVAEALAERKATVLDPSTNRPDLNPIERAWAWPKARLQ